MGVRALPDDAAACELSAFILPKYVDMEYAYENAHIYDDFYDHAPSNTYLQAHRARATENEDCLPLLGLLGLLFPLGKPHHPAAESEPATTRARHRSLTSHIAETPAAGLAFDPSRGRPLRPFGQCVEGGSAV